ncbi:unnamed protein product [Prunus armeniaca]
MWRLYKPLEHFQRNRSAWARKSLRPVSHFQRAFAARANDVQMVGAIKTGKPKGRSSPCSCPKVDAAVSARV